MVAILLLYPYTKYLMLSLTAFSCLSFKCLVILLGARVQKTYNTQSPQSQHINMGSCFSAKNDDEVIKFEEEEKVKENPKPNYHTFDKTAISEGESKGLVLRNRDSEDEEEISNDYHSIDSQYSEYQFPNALGRFGIMRTELSSPDVCNLKPDEPFHYIAEARRRSKSLLFDLSLLINNTHI